MGPICLPLPPSLQWVIALIYLRKLTHSTRRHNYLVSSFSYHHPRDFLTQANMISIRPTQSLGLAEHGFDLYQSRFRLAGQLRPERSTHSE